METNPNCVCGRLSTECHGGLDAASAEDPFYDLQIECDICHIWFHSRCVKLGRIGILSIDKYHCPRCESMCGASIMKPKTNDHRHNSTEEDAEDKPTQIGTKVFVDQLVERTFPNATDPGGVADTIESGRDLTLPYLSSSGFSRPIMIADPDGLGLAMPDKELDFEDVPSSVAEEQEIDVINVHSQDTVMMTLKDFCKAFETPVQERNSVVNCLSLEVSETALGDEVMPPLVARMLCWVTNVWPQTVQERWEGGEPPQVQKYCIMSMEGSYTDFHIDFGGTSVWYHIFKGEKIFYFIQPTASNLSLYERWQRMSGQNETFLGDMVDKCYKLVAKEGSTVFIPTGWIHAVLTPKDSLVFGGNFLHSLNIQLQLKVYDIEERIKTPKKFRFPQFEAVNWLAAQKLKNDLSDLNSDSTLCPSHLISGIKALLQALKSWLPDLESRTCPPSIDPHKLVRELAKELRLAEKVTLKCNPPKPERESKRKKQKKGLNEDFIDISRGNAFLFMGRVSKKKPPAKPKEPKIPTSANSQTNRQKPPGIKIVPKKRKISDLTAGSDEFEQQKTQKKPKVKKEKVVKVAPKFEPKSEVEEDENFSLSFAPPPEQRRSSPKHIKLKLPMSALNTQPYDLTDRDSVRQLLNSQKQHMKRLDSALGDALADFGDEDQDEDLVIDEKPIKLRLSLGQQQPQKKLVGNSPKKRPLKTVIRQRSKAMEDLNMTKVHQDEDYIYPSLELSDDEMEVGPTVINAKDDAWTPKVKVPRASLSAASKSEPRAARDRSKKVAAVEAGLKQAAENKRRKVGTIKKKKLTSTVVLSKSVEPVILSNPTVIPPPKLLESRPSSLLMNTPSSSSTLESVKQSLSRSVELTSKDNKKPKKGLSTAKQRLGKILKLKF